jgi:hypothetical protein
MLLVAGFLFFGTSYAESGFYELVKKSDAFKLEGDELRDEGKYEEAKVRYRKAVDYAISAMEWLGKHPEETAEEVLKYYRPPFRTVSVMTTKGVRLNIATDSGSGFNSGKF